MEVFLLITNPDHTWWLWSTHHVARVTQLNIVHSEVYNYSVLLYQLVEKMLQCPAVPLHSLKVRTDKTLSLLSTLTHIHTHTCVDGCVCVITPLQHLGDPNLFGLPMPGSDRHIVDPRSLLIQCSVNWEGQREGWWEGKCNRWKSKGGRDRRSRPIWMLLTLVRNNDNDCKDERLNL